MATEFSRILSFSLFILAGLLLLLTYSDFPIVRNSIIYAAIVQGITEYGIWQAAEFAQNKPLGFAILSWPFCEIWGVNVGLKIASYLGTVSFGILSIFFIKQLAKGYLFAEGSQLAEGSPKASSQEQINNAIIICLFNPLLVYQFISAYPDTLFATLFLAAVLSFERLLSKDGQFIFSFLAFFLVFLSIWVKHHGFVLLPIFLVMALYRREVLAEQWHKQKNRIKLSIICFLLLLALLNDAQQGELILFNVTHNSNNFLGGEQRLSIILANMENFVIFLLLSFSLLSPILLYLPAYKRQSYFLLPLVIIFILPILYYKGAQYNIRYFIALLPVLAWIIAGNLQLLPLKIRRITLALFMLFNGLTIAYYHHIGFHQWVQGTMLWETMPRETIKLAQIDNLRLISEQYPEKQHLALIKQYVESHANTLIYFSDYYKQGTFGVWQKAGLLPLNLQIHNFMQWQAEFLEQQTIEQAIIYEYIGVGTAINPIPNNPKYSAYLKKLTEQLYLFDLKHKL